MNSLSIEFSEISYNVKSVFDIFNWNVKKVLNEISGEFKSSEFTAILGPSGCGKTTLLNILSGFVSSNVTGSIKVNGKPINYNKFRKQSAFIMQEDNLHQILTLRETMMFSIRLKTGKAYTSDEQNTKIHQILKSLALNGHEDTFVRRLSGGQRKRLSIALELLDDPVFIFLDEPTSGLDSTSSTYCLSLLKALAKQGRTVICTLHTPSALQLEMFDNIYGLANGHCIYQGASEMLVPFFADLDLICPSTHNPADFLLEIANNEYGSQNHRLVEKIKNGASKKFKKHSYDEMIVAHDWQKINFSSSFINQVTQLTLRNLLFNRREKSFAIIRFIVHILLGIFVGIMYFQIGNEAEQIINIFKSIFIVLAILMFLSLFSLAVRFPLDLPILRKECFNQWYSVGAHYLALYIADFVVLTVCSIIFISISYVMIGHPLEGVRFGGILMVVTFMSIVAQVYGVFCGVLMDVKFTLCFASVCMMYQVIFAGGLVFMKDASYFTHWMFEASFMKHTVDAYVYFVLGLNRPDLDCNEMYCHFQSPRKFLNFIGHQEDTSGFLIALPIIWVAFHALSFGVMRLRLGS